MRKLTWKQALAWRMEQQFLGGSRGTSVEDVVRRLGAVQAQVASSAALAVAVRADRLKPDDVTQALAEGRVIKAWANRGTLHLITPDTGPRILSLLASGRWWDKPSFWSWFQMDPAQYDVLREAVRDALDGTALTRSELATAVTTRPGLEHVGESLRESWGTIFHPMTWLGDLCFAPSTDGQIRFTRPATISPGWVGIPNAAEAAPLVVADYLRAYGPSTVNRFRFWLAEGRILKRHALDWFHSLGNRMVEVDVDGESAYVLADDLDAIMATRPTSLVRFVSGFDQYVLGGGTDDRHVIPTGRRRDVSRQSGWIAPSVIAGGIVKGTWAISGERVRVAWFTESGRPPTPKLEGEVRRVGRILERDLVLEVALA
jgi:hypothetical protein